MRRQTVFLVEDNHLLLLILTRMIRRLGHTVVGRAASGEEAIRGIEDVCPDMVVMDIQLAGEITGIEAVSQIRKRQAMPVVYLSASTDLLAAEQQRRTDCTAFLIKPVTLGQLRETIQQLARSCPLITAGE